MLTKSFEVWTRSLIERLYNAVRRGNDITRSVTLTGTLTPLTSESAVYVTLLNTTGANANVSINGGASIVIPDKSGITLDTVDPGTISVSGTGTLSYIVSK
jgi:hypothetical protein